MVILLLCCTAMAVTLWTRRFAKQASVQKEEAMAEAAEAPVARTWITNPDDNEFPERAAFISALNTLYGEMSDEEFERRSDRALKA